MIYHEDSQLEIHNGDALTVLQTMAAESVQCCVTSPPYYGLRDYGTGQWEGGNADCDHIKPITNYNKGFNERYGNGDGTAAQKQEVKSAGQYSGTCKKCGAVRTDQQIGMEETPELFIANLIAVFREVRRVLKDDGTCWINIGDSYAGSGKGRNADGSHQDGGKQGTNKGTIVGSLIKTEAPNCKPKDIIGIPWMLAFALRADGWYLRQDIIWAKPNPMPESVADRCTKSHEYIFMLSKAARYFYDVEAIKEPAIYADDDRIGRALKSHKSAPTAQVNGIRPRTDKQRGHSRRRAGFNDRWDAMEKTEQCGGMRNKRSVWNVSPKPYPEAHFATYPPELITPCVLAGCPEGGTVLDPFAGSGTTAQVANKFGRRAILIELNREYCELILRRNCQKTLFATTEAA